MLSPFDDDDLVSSQTQVADDDEGLVHSVPPSESDQAPTSDVDDGSSTVVNPSKKRKGRSQYWEHYNLPAVNGKVQCKHCPTRISIKDDHSTGTSTSRRHQQKHGHYVALDPKQPRLMPMGTFNKDKALERLHDFIVGDQQAFFLVENSAFLAFVHALQPTFKMPKADAVREQLLEHAELRRGKLETYLAALNSKITITTDAWAAPNADQYLAITAHWIDSSFRQQHILLAFKAFPTPHTAAAAEEIVFEAITSWGIEAKVLACVTDNASSAYNISKLLADRLAPLPFLPMRCRAHALQLVVKDALQDDGIKTAVAKVRKFCAKVRRSAPLQAALQAACAKWDVKYTRPQRDMEVRWSSTFSMLDTLLPMKPAISYLQQQVEYANEFADTQFVAGNWLALKEVRDTLEPFKLATDWLQGQYVTLSMIVRMYDVLVRKVSEFEDKNASGIGHRLAVRLANGLKDRKELLVECMTTQWAGILDPSLKMGLITLYPRPQQVTASLTTFVDKYYKAAAVDEVEQARQGSQESNGTK